MSLTGCAKKAGDALRKVDRTAIFSAAHRYRKSGMSADDAGRKAIADQIAAVQAMLGEVAPAPVAEPVAEVVAPTVQASADDAPPPITEAQARKQFEWRNLGQKDNVKTHALFFFEKPEDKGTGNAMGQGMVTLYDGASGWQVDDSGERYKSLVAAKKAAIDAAIPRLQDSGYVVKDDAAPVATDAAPVAEVGQEPAPTAAEPEAKPVESSKSEPKAKIENFGEALPPSRRAMAAKLDEALSDDDIASRPLSEIWPLTENEAIEDTFAAAVAHAARAEVPAKPRLKRKVERWVEKVKAVRSLAAMIVSGRVSRERFIEVAKERSLDDWLNKVLLLEQVSRDQWKRIGAVEERPESFNYVDGKQIKSPMLRILVDDKSHFLRGDKSVEGDARGTVDGNRAGIMSLLAAEEPQRRMEFDVRQRRKDGSVFINKKGDSQHRPLMEFANVAQARKAISEQYDSLVSAWEAIKASDNITERDLRSAENRPRVGKDHRGGRDITSDEFENRFGFKGGEWGKWVKQGSGAKERQELLNSTYDAMMDLSDILNLPPRAISLNGTLGLAFGSRGGGWASAHFEPSNLVINLTKPRGAGALAHEWFHAMDNYFSRLRRDGAEAPFTGDQAKYRNENYITHQPEVLMVPKSAIGNRYLPPMPRAKLEAMHEARKHLTDAYDPARWHIDPKNPISVRPEVEARFVDLVKALDDSPMSKRSKVLDGSSGYWSRTIERAARSFEIHIQARMMELGYHNDFLANIVPVEKTGRNPDRYPYLLPGEVKPIADAFDALFDTIQTKEDDAGNVALFSRNATLDAQTDTPAFRKWFGDSKVVDADGKPLVVYHGTNASFDQFDKEMSREGDGLVFASPNRKVASDFAMFRTVWGGANVMPIYVKASRLLDIDGGGRPIRDVENAAKIDGMKYGETLRDYAQREGFDGIHFRDVTDDVGPDMPPMADVYAFFQSAQIKSATGNRGTFDAGNPDIRFSRDTPAPVRKGGQPAAQVDAMVQLMTAKWANRPKVVVVQNLDDPRVPPKVRKKAQSLRSTDTAGAPDGFFNDEDGSVFLIADQIGGDMDTLRVLMHESLGHFGLRGLYGAELGTILDRIATLNAAKVRDAANILGLDFDNAGQRRLAAEEVLAYMAQNQPEIGWVKSAVAAVRTWLRDHVPGFSKMKMTDAELIRNYILPARRFVENGGASMSASGNVTTQAFSRNLGGALTAGLNNVRDVKLPAGYAVSDMLAASGRLHWWHKTVGTMYHTAQRNPPFKRVYDAVQEFLNDVSYYSAAAADLAPSILPKLDKWTDIAKTPLSPEDTKALSAPVFAGTLTWGRDEAGVARPMDEITESLGATAVDDKAHMLMRAGHIDPKVLRMWQGLEADKYEGIINAKFEKEILKPGVVFTDAELKKHFGLSDAQIALYREFRSATDKSLDNLAISEMLRYAGKDAEAIRPAILDMDDIKEVSELLRDQLMELAAEHPGRAAVLEAAANKMIDIADHARDMKDKGYAPLSRFGDYTLEATLETGERFFSLYESARERNKAARMLMAEGATGLSTGTMSQEDHKLLNGISPETAALFGEMLGLDDQGSEAKDLAYQEFIKRGTANRSAMKRLIHRKGIAGFSEDAGRVLAGFVYSNGRKTSSNLHQGTITSAVSDIPKEQGQLKDAAVKLRDYVSNPQEEAQGFRGILFAQYLGGSVASAMVNATQPFAITFPYLSQFGGVRKAAVQMAAAVKDATKDTTGDARLDAALLRAEELGIVSPQEVHYLQAQASGRAQLVSGDGTAAGNAIAKGRNSLSKLSLAWGKVFGIAEQFNRRVTFIAAYRTAVAHKMADPAAFAEKAVAETQFTYNMGNKPRWARGAIGGILFTFKTYSVSYVEVLHRMATAGEPGSAERAAGQKAAVLALAVLFLMGGADGLPFMEDVQDVIDGALQRLGYNFSTKQQMREFLATHLGKDGGEFAMSGISGLPGAPIDVSGRLGMGNLIPGTGMFQKKQDYGRDMLELAGPAGDLVYKRGREALEKAFAGDIAGAAATIAPTAARNVIKAVDMANTGMYRDTRGRKVIDTTLPEALGKGLGFQPRTVAEVQEASGEVARQRAQYTLALGEIREKWALGIFEGNESKKESARKDLETWNRNNPDQRMQANMGAILRRVREMRKTKAQRMADTAPKAIRANVRRQLAQDEA